MRARTNLSRRQRLGFTLMELAVALAATGVIAATATTLFSLYSSLIKKARVQSQLVSRARGSLEYVLNESRRAGGDGVSARDSMIIEAGCSPRGAFPDCYGTDRITVVQPLGGYGKCTVDADLGGNRVRIKSLRDGFAGPLVCCLLEQPNFKRQVAFSSAAGVTPAVLFGTSEPCTFRYEPIVGGPSGSLNNATLVMADVKTFYLELTDPTRAGRLVMHMELDGDTSSITRERLYLATGVLDLQASRSGDMLAVSTLIGMEHPDGVRSGDTALSPAARTLSVPYLLHEASARVALRNTR
jgi:prepilin-type N-terminal cleavage/methylation domain-containing protein